MDYHKFISAAQKLEQASSARRQSTFATLEEVVADAAARGDGPRAIAAVETLLAKHSDATRWWHELALMRLRGGDALAADVAWRRALQGNHEELPLLHQIGLSLAASGYDPASFAERAWASQQQVGASLASPGPLYRSREFRATCLDVLRQDWTKALPFFRELQRSRPDSLQASLNLAFLLEHLHREGEAECVLAANKLARGQPHEAAEAFEAAPEQDARAPTFLAVFLHALRLAGKEQRAIEIVRTVAPDSCPPAAYREWSGALLDLHHYEEAVETLLQGAVMNDDDCLKLQADLTLPPVPMSQATLEHAHRHVCLAIRKLAEKRLPENPDELAALEPALGANFYMACLGPPYVEEARASGQFAQRVMRARFPRHAESRTPRVRNLQDRIRIGYATSYANRHVVMRCVAGWLQHADRDAFELHLFPLATRKNPLTAYVASLVDNCHDPETDTEAAARQIVESELDVLVYPEIGMDPLSFRLAAMRLAPVQCVAGGHPVTTGLDTIDYFLSASIGEPANAAEHYTEQLVMLPGTGYCISPPGLPSSRKSRADFGLQPGQIVYLSPQSLFKYLPCHDEAFARIAESVDDAVFVFVEGKFPAWTRTFSERLRRAFRARGLSPDRHLRFVPRQDYDDFLHLNAVSDVFLDPPGGWSAGMTALDSLACGLPIVTLPGALIRTRMVFGLLSRMGMTDTIATDLDDYVRLAIHLGKDADRRAELSQRIQTRRHVLFDDVGCVRALEGFFRWATGSPGQDDTTLFKLA